MPRDGSSCLPRNYTKSETVYWLSFNWNSNSEGDRGETHFSHLKIIWQTIFLKILHCQTSGPYWREPSSVCRDLITPVTHCTGSLRTKRLHPPQYDKEGRGNQLTNVSPHCCSDTATFFGFSRCIKLVKISNHAGLGLSFCRKNYMHKVSFCWNHYIDICL